MCSDLVFSSVMESVDEQGAKTQDEGASRAEGPPSFMGKHRLTAAISHLHNQINLIQEELNELETMGESSLVCNELISSIESSPDPLLPMTKGPVDDSWERWFRGAHNLRTNIRWMPGSRSSTNSGPNKTL